MNIKNHHITLAKIRALVVAIVLTFAATITFAVIMLRPEWLLSVWFVGPLTAVIFFILGTFFQRAVSHSAYKKLFAHYLECKEKNAKLRAKLEKANHDLHDAKTTINELTWRNNFREVANFRVSTPKEKASSPYVLDSEYVGTTPSDETPDTTTNEGVE